MYINTAMVYGNLTRDPELRALPSGGAVASFAIATNRSYKKSDGTKAEQTEFHQIIVFGRTAQSCAQYLRRGSSAYVEGRLQTRSWEKDGVKQYKTEIVAERVQFGPRPPKSDVAADSDPNQVPPSERAPEGSTASDTAIDYPSPEDEGIPATLSVLLCTRADLQCAAWAKGERSRARARA
jgi:single-strand DNA-binding protein